MAGTRQRIVTATAELFRRRGFNGTGLKDVTSAAAATTGSLYHFFPGGKSDLAAAVITESGAAYQQLFEVMADEAGSPAEAISGFFTAAADVLEQSDFIDLCPIGTVAGEIASTNDELRGVADRVFAGWIEAAASRLRAAGLSATAADELATTIVASLQGGFLLARCRRDADLLRVAGQRMHELVATALANAPTRSAAGRTWAGSARRSTRSRRASSTAS